MKKLALLALFMLTILTFSCKKKDMDMSPIGYTISVKVSDGVSYKIELKDREPIIRNSNPNEINTSYSTTQAYKPLSAPFISVTTVPFFKDEFFDVTVTKTSTGEVIKHIKEKEKVFFSWSVN